MLRTSLHKLFFFFLFSFFFISTGLSQHNRSYFESAYNFNPHIPRGIIEAVSFVQTRISNINANETPSCTGMPLAQGYMGLIIDGEGYFNNTAAPVAKLFHLTNISEACKPQYAVLGYATLLAQKINENLLLNDEFYYWNNISLALESLSEIPNNGNPVNDFARMSFVYEVFKFLNDTAQARQYNFKTHNIDMEKVFGMDNYKILTAKKIMFSRQGISNGSGLFFKPNNPTVRSSQYGPAIWTPAPTCNYSSRNGVPVSAITIHTVQGTYAGAISWAQNCASSVSYHYVIRSSDGQVTQMVDEANKAWHVGSENPYTIGYEHEGYVSNPAWYTTAMYTSSADVSRDICNSGYGINPLRTYYGPSSSGTNVLGGCTKIKGHQHYPNQSHTDPGIYWDWEKYYKLINNAPSVTTITSATGSFYDSGGPVASYTDDERLLWLFSPTGASTVTLSFSQFNIENNWDYMFIYDGNSTSSPLIGIYTGTVSPGSVSSTGSSLLVEFRSDCNTVNTGWAATFNSTTPQPTDITPPTTLVSAPSNWITQNFTATFNDADNTGGSGIEKAFYQCSDFNAGDWRSNAQRGFFSDYFDQVSIHPEWTSVTGSWNLNNGALQQTDDSQNNTNIYAYVNHSLSNRYLYHWSGKMDGTGTNRRSGLHYFCDDPTLTNRGNSYFAWFRLDSDQIEIYEVVNDVFTLMANVTYNFNVNQWYDFKVAYDRVTGKTMVYVDNSLKLIWTDTTPYAGGDYVSFRSGNAVFSVDNFNVYRSRTASENIQVGPNGDLRYQNSDPNTEVGKIKSIIHDVAGNISSVAFTNVNVDTTQPDNILIINDGPNSDIDTFYNNTTIEANWIVSADTHSDIARYWYAVGTFPNGNNVINWTDNAWNDSITVAGLSLTYGVTYYVAVKAENGAGLESIITVSDGMYLATPTLPPQAGFIPSSTIVCSADSVQFSNISSNAVTYQWLFPGGSPVSSAFISPKVHYASSGTYTATLIATGPGGTDTITNTFSVVVNLQPVASFIVSSDTVSLPNAMVGFSNQSQNADGYAWYFGDGNFSNGASPWNIYMQPGTYTVIMIASTGGCVDDTADAEITVLGPNAVNEISEEKINYFPNPAINEFTFHTNGDGGKLYWIDITGKQVLAANIQRGNNMINISALAQGVYLVRYVAVSGVNFIERIEIMRP